MVQDINPPSFARSASKFRKAGNSKKKKSETYPINNTVRIAGEFRDTQLLDICETAYKTLEELVKRNIAFTSSKCI